MHNPNRAHERHLHHAPRALLPQRLGNRACVWDGVLSVLVRLPSLLPLSLFPLPLPFPVKSYLRLCSMRELTIKREPNCADAICRSPSGCDMMVLFPGIADVPNKDSNWNGRIGALECEVDFHALGE